MSRVEIVESVSDVRGYRSGLSPYKRRGPGNEARAGMAGVTGGRARDRVESLVIVRSLHVTTPSGELADKELLGEACANSLSRADRKISEH